MKFDFDFKNISTTKKVLPLIGLGLGLGLARYKKACVKCHIIAGIGGFVLGSLPLLYEAKKIGDANTAVAEVKLTPIETK
jgi:hypothetical protein